MRVNNPTNPLTWRHRLSSLLDFLARPFGRFLLSVVLLLFGAGIAVCLAWLLLRAVSEQQIHKYVLEMCKALGIEPSKHVKDVFLALLVHHFSAVSISLFDAVLLPLVFRPTTILRWLRRRWIPINPKPGVESLACFREYFLGAAVGICKSLPPELSSLWESEVLQLLPTLKHSRLIKPHCRQERDAQNKTSVREIADIWRYLDDYLLDASGWVPPIMVHGEPGSGKSVLLYHVFGERALQLLRCQSGWIPLLIFAYELTEKDFPSGITLKEFLVNYFEAAHRRKPRLGCDRMATLIEQHYHENQFLIIVDGLDELPERDRYYDVLGKLNALLTTSDQATAKRRHPDRFIISCRTDDNPDYVQGQLIRIQALEYRQSIAYLNGLAKFFTREKDLARAKAAGNAVAGLTASKKQCLLRNYVDNPFLLSLISQYYSQSGVPNTNWLKDVFRGVFEREIQKVWDQRQAAARERHEQTPPQLDPAKIHRVVDHQERVIGPFCFERSYSPERNAGTTSTDMDGDAQAVLFEKTLRKGLGVGRDLFGKGDGQSPLEVFYRDPSNLDNSLDLSTAGGGPGEEDGKWFVNQLKLLRKTANSQAFQHEACELLRQKALSWLDETRLAEVARPEGKTAYLVRFRHRRLADYFAAKCFNGSPTPLELIESYLENAWIREPLRIFAAVADDPGTLLRACVERCHNLKHDPRTAADVLRNAAAAVEYLPRSRPSSDTVEQQLDKTIVEIGREALKLAVKCSSESDHDKVLNECQTTITAVFTAEYWSGLEKKRRTAIFRSGDTLLMLDRWNRCLIRRVAVQSSWEQLVAYRQLWPLKAAVPELAISRCALFILIVHSAPFFWGSYNYAVKDTQPRLITRLPLFFASLLTRTLSVGIIGGVILWLRQSPLPDHSIVAFTILLLLSGALAQTMGWMDLLQAYKLIPWGAVCLCKRIHAHYIHRADCERNVVVVPTKPQVRKTETTPHESALPPRTPNRERADSSGPATTTVPSIVPPSARKERPRPRSVPRLALPLGLVVFAWLTWSVSSWLGPFARQCSARRAIAGLQKQVKETADQHQRQMAFFQHVKGKASVEDLSRLEKELKHAATEAEVLAKRVRETFAATANVRSRMQSSAGILDALNNESNEARAAAEEAKNRVFELRNIQSTVASLADLQKRCLMLSGEGNKLIVSRPNGETVTELEEQLKQIQEWNFKANDAHQSFAGCAQIATNVPHSSVGAATQALTALAITETNMARLTESLRNRRDLVQQRERTQNTLADAEALATQGNELVSAVSQSPGNDLILLSKQHNASEMWLTNARSKRTDLENCQSNQPFMLSAEIMRRTGKNLRSAEENVTKVRESLRGRIQELRLQGALRELANHGQKGLDLLSNSISGLQIQDLKSAESQIGKWLEKAELLGVEASLHMATNHAVKDFAGLVKQLQAKQQQLTNELAEAARAAEDEQERRRLEAKAAARSRDVASHLQKGSNLLARSVLGMELTELQSAQSDVIEWLSSAAQLAQQPSVLNSNTQGTQDLLSLSAQLRTNRQQITDKLAEATRAAEAEQARQRLEAQAAARLRDVTGHIHKGSNLLARPVLGMESTELQSAQLDVTGWLKAAETLTLLPPIGRSDAKESARLVLVKELSNLTKNVETRQQDIIQATKSAEMELARRKREAEKSAILGQVMNHLQKGSNLLLRSLSPRQVADLKSMHTDIDGWLNSARELNSLSSVKASGAKEATDLPVLIGRLQEEEQRITQAIKTGEAEQGRKLREAEATALLEGEEWKNLAGVFDQYKDAEHRDKELWARVESLLQTTNRSLNSVKRSLELLVGFKDRVAMLPRIQPSFADYARRLEDLSNRSELVGTEASVRLRSRKVEVGKIIKTLADLGAWSISIPIDDRSEQLKVCTNQMEADQARAKQARRDFIAKLFEWGGVLILAGIVWWLFGSLRWNGKLGEVESTMDGLETFLCERKGCPLPVAKRTVKRMEKMAQEDILARKADKERKRLTEELCARFEKIKRKVAGRGLGYNAEQIATLLQQVIDGLNNVRNR